MIERSDFDDLLNVLRGEDDLGVVIRAHILIESKLEAFLRRRIPRYKYLEEKRFSYAAKIDLALAMGLNPRFSAPLRKLGQIRNDFAHKPGMKLSNRHVTDLFGALDAEDRRIVLESFDNTKAKVPEFPNKPFNKHSPKDRLSLVVVSLYALFEILLNELNKRKHNNGFNTDADKPGAG